MSSSVKLKTLFNTPLFRQYTASILSLALITLIFFWRIPLQGYVLLSADILYTYEPWRSETPGALGEQPWNPWLSDGVRHTYPMLAVVQASWREGKIPFWNPYSLSGAHLLASGINFVFYPITMALLLLLPVAHAISWATILHTFLGALFCFLFIKELGTGHFAALIGAVIFSFGAPLVDWMPYLATFQPIIWLPLLFLAWQRAVSRQSWPWAIAGGGILFLQLLAGNIQGAYYSLTGLGLYALSQAGLIWFSERNGLPVIRMAIYFFLLIITGLGLAAIQLLPTLELLSQGARGQTQLDFQFPAETLLRIIVPDILGTDLDNNITQGFTHELYLYLGILPLLFLVASAFSPHKKQALSMISFGLLVLLVTYQVPPYQLFALFYPSFDILGFHRALFLTAFFWSVAIGLGADWIFTARPTRMLAGMLRLGGLLWVGLGSVTVGLAFISKYQARSMWNLPLISPLEPPALYLLSTLIFSLLILGLGLLLLNYWQQARISQGVLSTALLSLIIVDLFLAHMDHVTSSDPAKLYPPTPSLKFIQNLVAQETQPCRILTTDRLLWGDISTVFSLPGIQGYDPFLTSRYSQYLDLTGARQETNHRIAAFEAKTDRLIDALNVKYYYAPRYKLSEGDWISLIDQLDKPSVESEHSYAGQVDEWIVGGWPQRVLLAPTSSRISYRGYLEQPAQIETAIAIAPEEWTRPGAEVLFEVYVRSAASEEVTRLFSKSLSQLEQPGAPDLAACGDRFNSIRSSRLIVSFVTQASEANVKWNAAWAEPLLADSSKVELLHYGPNSVYLNKGHLPRAWIVHEVIEVTEGDVEAVKAALSEPTFEPAQKAAIEGKLSQAIAPAVAGEAVEFLSASASEALVQVKLSSPGFLVLSEMASPGWLAYVDEAPQPLLVTNLTMQGVYAPAGEHKIKLIYQPFSFQLGLYISLTTFLVIVIAFLIKNKSLIFSRVESSQGEQKSM